MSAPLGCAILARVPSFDDTELREHLLRTLDDRRLSRAERKSLRALVAEAGDAKREDEQEERVRRLAFDVAKDALADADPLHIPLLLEWLEDVSRAVTLHERQRAGAEASAHSAVYFSPGDACRNRIHGAIREARERIDICVFTITDDRLSEALVAAHRRGVNVRIASDNDKALDRGSDIEKLAHEGIAVRVDQSPHHMHHKFAIFDGALLLNGSYNWTRSAFTSNRENIVETRDAGLVADFSKAFDALFGEFAN